MMKHLFWYPWIMAALVAGILACLALIAHMLLSGPPQPAYYPDAQLVLEGMCHALA